METKVGKVTHYFGKIMVCALALQAEIKVGDTLRFTGGSTELTQTITSMQINKQAVESAKPGEDVAIKVKEPVRVGDLVYKVTE
jgi:translation initiation factor IF-2